MSDSRVDTNPLDPIRTTMSRNENVKHLGFTNEIRRIVLLADGVLAAYFLEKTEGILNRLVTVTSEDNGSTWGEPVTLSSYLGDSNVVLLFYRTGS